MIISRDQLIVGRPAVEVRDLLRVMRGRGFTTSGLAERAGMTDVAAEHLVADLQAAGLVARVDHPMEVVAGTAETDVRFDELVLVTTTIAGNALAKARIGRRMERSVAEELLRGVLDRAVEVNDSDVWLHCVREVVLYGSLASDSQETVGDVDVAVGIEPRFGVDEFDPRQEQMIDGDGARPATLIDAMGYAQRKLLRLLRGRSARVDLLQAGIGQPLPPGARYRTVYEYEPPRSS